MHSPVSLLVNTKADKAAEADQILVASILAGEPHAFRELIDRTEKLVAQFVFKMIPAAAERKDIAQEVYLKVHQNLPGFRFQSKLSTWIGQITYNTCLHYLEKKRPVLLEHFFYDTPKEPGDGIAFRREPGENETENKWYERELKGIIEGAVSQLPPLYQTLIGLYYQEELSLSEICEITGLPDGTVKAYLFRARKQLKVILLKPQKRQLL